MWAHSRMVVCRLRARTRTRAGAHARAHELLRRPRASRRGPWVGGVALHAAQAGVRGGGRGEGGRGGEGGTSDAGGWADSLAGGQLAREALVGGAADEGRVVAHGEAGALGGVEGWFGHQGVEGVRAEERVGAGKFGRRQGAGQTERNRQGGKRGRGASRGGGERGGRGGWGGQPPAWALPHVVLVVRTARGRRRQRGRHGVDAVLPRKRRPRLEPACEECVHVRVAGLCVAGRVWCCSRAGQG
jgi:hypothetical protein